MRPIPLVRPLLQERVSIHAPWEGCDSCSTATTCRAVLFQFTHPGKGATVVNRASGSELLRFQFTHPGKGATGTLPWTQASIDGFNSRTLGRVRQMPPLEVQLMQAFQFTHPGKGATANGAPSRQGWMFQFTHPGKGATLSSYLRRKASQVSIHAPWEGCDRGASSVAPSAGCFNSRTLGRVRRTTGKTQKLFNSVSIHAPWEGCDLHGVLHLVRFLSFNSRTLGRVRRALSLNLFLKHNSFNSRTLGRVRLAWRTAFSAFSEFQFTHPGKGATAP